MVAMSRHYECPKCHHTWSVKQGGGTHHKAANALGVKSIKADADNRARKVIPKINFIKHGGIKTLRGIAAELNKQKVPTPRGGQWSAPSVQNLIRRARVLGL